MAVSIVMGTRRGRRTKPILDCVCSGQVPFCAPCLLALAIHMRIQHPNTLSVAMIRRRIPGIDGRTAWILLEATKLVDY